MVLSEKKLRFQLPDPEPHPAERILDVVIEMLESGGYDAVQLREVGTPGPYRARHHLQALPDP